jgi:hypothetical protein
MAEILLSDGFLPPAVLQEVNENTAMEDIPRKTNSFEK